MNVSRLLITTACSLAIAGATSVAFAQTTTPSPTAPTANPSQATGQREAQMPATTTAPAGTTPGTMTPTTPTATRPADPMTSGSTTTSTPATSGTMAPRPADGSLRTPADRTPADRATMGTERPARADRN